MLFVIWTVLLRFIDVKAIGPLGSSVGFATLNSFARNIVGFNTLLYIITDWFGIIPIATALGFAVLGVKQWISRKSLLKVDYSIFALGVFYIAVIAVFCFFEGVVINYRPVLIFGELEASYPSSTTMLVMCVMPTAAMQIEFRIKNPILKKYIMIGIIIFVILTVVIRFLSGVHWLTDIIGGVLISAALVTMYYALVGVNLTRHAI